MIVITTTEYRDKVRRLKVAVARGDWSLVALLATELDSAELVGRGRIVK